MNFIYESNRIVLYGEDKGILAEVTFPSIDEQTVMIDHTFVDESLRGQGVAGKLMAAAAAELKKQNRKAVLSCTYAITWFEKHPEYSDLIVPSAH